MSTDPKTAYIQALKNTHAEEVQGLHQLQRQEPRLEAYPEYQALVRDHIEATGRQLARVEAALEETGMAPATLREAVTAAVGNAGAALHALMPDETLKNLYAGYAFQAHQIAAYTSLAVLAEAGGFPQHGSWIAETLDEEQAGLKAAEKIIAPVTVRFLELAQQD
jgi:ferritin-like metal-binding protein YciE